MEVIVEEKKRNEREDGSHALFSQVVRSYWYLQHLFVCHLERSYTCPLMENWDKSKGTLFRPFLVGTFQSNVYSFGKRTFFLVKSLSQLEGSFLVLLRFEIRYSPFGTTIRDLDICLNMFKCKKKKKNFFTCYLLLFTC